MALLNTTPQAQLTSMWNGLRHLTAGHVRLPTSQTRKEDVQCSTRESVEKTQSSIPSCVTLLSEMEFDPVTLSVVKSPRQSLKPHWRVSHRSNDSFQQNIQANSEEMEYKIQEVCSAVFDRHPLSFNPSSVNNVMYQQIRGFKTRRSESSGLSGAKRIGRIDTIKVPAGGPNFDAELFNQATRNSADEEKFGFGKFQSKFNVSAENQEDLKMSFADGFHAGGDWKAISPGLKKAGGNLQRTQAFLEGYKCYVVSNLPQGDPKQSLWGKLTSRLWKVLALSLIIAFVVVGVSPRISVKKVSLFNGEDFEVNPETVTITFNDVRGSSEAKAELANIVDFLKHPEKYTNLGAKLPNGCLLVGPPGVGKTLLAKAVAGEAGVPFFQASGAEFDEVYVGTGAKRVRQLFQAAKAKAPCVIFIDEIDSVGSKRTSSELHPYANQTVNQLLTEMDGFQPNEGVIVLGATNKRNNLDKALLRPGRFDVEVPIRVPDLKERIDILDLYLPKLVTDSTVDVSTVAKRTTGCTGADLNNICNHAAIQAAIVGSPVVTMEHIEFAIDKVQMGPQKKRIQSDKVNQCTAYHEAGHAIVQYFCHNNAKKLHKITILPRGQSLGMTHFLLDETSEFQETREAMLGDLDALMGGRIAEELIFGENKVTTGASSDMSRATGIATRMVRMFGFSDKMGLRVYSSNDDIVSEKIKEEMDQEIKLILKESYDRAKKLLSSKQKELGWLANALLEYEELSFEEAKIIIEGGKLNKTVKSKPPPPSKSGPPQPKSSDVGPTKPITPVKL